MLLSITVRLTIYQKMILAKAEKSMLDLNK